MLQTQVIKNWIDDAVQQLIKADISTAHLDAEIILSNALEKDRTFLHAHSEDLIDESQLKIANKNLKMRLERMPIAYITGYKEFYGRNFIVTKNTLIPRPESENIIEILKKIVHSSNDLSQNYKEIVDVGTGSGCLGITAKLEFPNSTVTLVDISEKALAIAKKNAVALKADVNIIQNDLLEKIDSRYDIIIANLPYVDPSWQRSPETNYEPGLALFADKNGQDIIEKLILQSNNHLTTNGFLIIEADPEQHDSLIEFAKLQFLTLVDKQDYIIAFKK